MSTDFFNSIYKYIIKHPPGAKKYFLIVVILLSLFVAGRFGLFGSNVKNISSTVTPTHIDFIDGVRLHPNPDIYIESSGCSGQQYIKRLPSQAIKLGESVKVNYKVSTDSYVSVFGQDSAGFYGIFPTATLSGELENINSQKIAKNQQYYTEFELSGDEDSSENFYIIAGYKSLPSMSVKNFSQNIVHTTSKGPAKLLDVTGLDDFYIKSIEFKVKGNCE